MRTSIGTPHTHAIEDGIRGLGRDSKPVFLSEYGIGSLMNAVRELQEIQTAWRTRIGDMRYFKSLTDKFTRTGGASAWRASIHSRGHVARQPAQHGANACLV